LKKQRKKSVKIEEQTIRRAVAVGMEKMYNSIESSQGGGLRT